MSLHDRLPRARRWAAAAGAAALLVAGVPIVTGLGVGPATAATTTYSPVSGDHAWDPVTKAPNPEVPTVAVDQVDNLTDQVVHVTWQHFTPSSNRAGHFFSAESTLYGVTVLECRGLNPTDPTTWRWPDFGPDCYNHTPDDESAKNGVGNQVYTLTGQDGGGEAYFHVETKDENDFLGCSSTVPCSLVVVPNWGGTQPAGTAPGSPSVKCAVHTGDMGGIMKQAGANLIGAACSWADRIVVPLHFAPTPGNCPAKDFSFASEGAPQLSRTFQQWQAGWCTGARALSFDADTGTNEYLARDSFLNGSGALQSSTDVALVNRPADAAVAAKRKFVYAPLTNTAITVAYHVDNQVTGQLVTDLTLNARLVAKLLTQSYSLGFGCLGPDDTTTQGPTCDPAVKGNPPDIFDDPEFQALNSQYPRSVFPFVSDLQRGQFLPLVVSGNSDLVHELTRWVLSDKAARDFLAGTPDSHGMHVNTYYKNEPFPLDQFQTLDPGYTAPPSNGTPGVSTMQVSWNPISGMTGVVTSLVNDRPSGISNTLPSCGGAGQPCVYPRFGSQAPGRRALFAVVGLTDAAASRFPTARLVNASGHAVGPDGAALAAGLKDMTTNADKVTRSANFASTDAAQYPLTISEYAMVPACGLDATRAAGIKSFLTHVTSSQTIGALPGQLTAGNVPLTSAQLAQTKAAAAAVSTARCSVPAEAKPPAKTTSTTHSGGSDGAPTGGANGGAGPRANDGSHSDPKVVTTPTATTPTTQPAQARTVSYGYKRADAAADMGAVLPIALIAAAALVIGGPGVLVLMTTATGATLRRRFLAVVRR